MKEISCLARNVYYEARGESLQGQKAVALVTLNRVENPMFPNTICGVVNERKVVKGTTKCQFSWRCESHTNPKKAVRQRYKDGSDVIKITATGGVMSIAKNGQNPQFTLEEIKSICDTANDYGMTVAAHAHGDEGIKRAIMGGVTTIEHGTLMSDNSMKLMKDYGVYYVPTITAGKEVGEKAKIDGYYNKLVVPKALAIGPKIQSTFEKAYKSGVKIAFGSDAGVFPHGENAREFKYMNEVGMPEIECIQSATTTNATLLGQENNLGKIKKGFIADIIATNLNPLEDISVLENIIFVMKEGVVYKN